MNGATDSSNSQLDHRLLADVLNGLEDGVIVVTRDFHIDFVNRKALEMFPFQTTPVGRLLIELVQQESINTVVAKCIDTGKAVKERLHLPGPARRVLLVSVAPVDQDRVQAILRDETRQFEIEQVRRDFVANASHELRTPLTIINGYLENLLQEDGLEDRESTVRFLKTMKKHGDRIASLIEDMLTISKLESSSASIKQERFPLRRCVEETLDRLAPKIDSRRIRIDVDIADDVHLVGDKFYWDQIFFNLMDNALKYNPSGELAISITHQRNENGDEEIRVGDNGIGISRKDLPYVFARFYRSENRPLGSIKGTGLGLSIVRRAVEAHGGEITLVSRPGLETVFGIRVPGARKSVKET